MGMTLRLPSFVFGYLPAQTAQSEESLFVNY
jgi:hypothetical protein